MDLRVYQTCFVSWTENKALYQIQHCPAFYGCYILMIMTGCNISLYYNKIICLSVKLAGEIYNRITLVSKVIYHEKELNLLKDVKRLD